LPFHEEFSARKRRTEIRIENKTASQTITVQTVKIPEVKAFDKLMTVLVLRLYVLGKNGLTPWKIISKTGTEYFSVFQHTDYYYQLINKENPNIFKLIAKAREKGLKMAEISVVLCDRCINKNGKNAILLNGKTRKYRLSRNYLKSLMTLKENLHRPWQVQRQVSIFSFSIRNLTGPVRYRACPACENEWKEFLSRNVRSAHKTLVVTYTGKDNVYMPLMQEFWDEFYC
jgi:hypothetical protein